MSQQNLPGVEDAFAPPIIREQAADYRPPYSTSWAVTGHRYNRINEHTLADGTIAYVPVMHGISHAHKDYGLGVKNRLQRYCQLTLAEINPKPSVMLIGMADGFDLEMAMACVVQKIPFIACLPFKGHASEQNALITKAVEINYVSQDKYRGNWQYIKRDEYMVRQAMQVLAFWNGDPRSGTGITVRYAEGFHKPIHNCWQPWARVVYKDTRPCHYPIKNSIAQPEFKQEHQNIPPK